MDTNQHEPIKRPRPSVRWWIVALAGLFGASGLWWLNVRTGQKLDESCANCRSFVEGHLTAYAEAHKGWYPRGGASPLDSLAKCVQEPQLLSLRHFTSHALGVALENYWEKHRTFSPEFTCYCYNEGLHTNSASGMVVMYFFRPTHWECSSHKSNMLGRPVLLTPIESNRRWDFLTEEEFQKKQAATLEYLARTGLEQKEKKLP